MKKLLIFTFLILSSTLLCFRVYAQTPVSAPVNSDPFKNNQEPIIQDVEGFRAEFKQYTQDPESKAVKFEMILKSGVDSDRVKITWSLAGTSAFQDKTQATKDIIVAAGKTYTIPITIIPTGYGVSELRAKAEAFKAENSYLVSIRKNYASNESAEILPITPEYTQAKTLSIVKTIVIVIVVFILLAIGAVLGFKRFVKWLNKDDRR